MADDDELRTLLPTEDELQAVLDDQAAALKEWLAEWEAEQPDLVAVLRELYTDGL